MNTNDIKTNVQTEEKEQIDPRKAWHLPELSESDYGNLSEVIMGSPV
ncbi:MAG: hypothetical protein HQM10_08710 [Candidatus Riflebacteria bacterium]|nr:hypothetical protein [Candidatus Riflebacteria bacterium]